MPLKIATQSKSCHPVFLCPGSSPWTNANTGHRSGFEAAIVGCQGCVSKQLRGVFAGRLLCACLYSGAADENSGIAGSRVWWRLRDDGHFWGRGAWQGKWRSPQVQEGKERRKAGFRIDLPIQGLGHSINNPSFVLGSCLMASLRFAGRSPFRWGGPRDVIRKGQELTLSDLMLMTSLCKGSSLKSNGGVSRQRTVHVGQRHGTNQVPC